MTCGCRLLCGTCGEGAVFHLGSPPPSLQGHRLERTLSAFPPHWPDKDRSTQTTLVCGWMHSKAKPIWGQLDSADSKGRGISEVSRGNHGSRIEKDRHQARSRFKLFFEVLKYICDCWNCKHLVSTTFQAFHPPGAGMTKYRVQAS